MKKRDSPYVGRIQASKFDGLVTLYPATLVFVGLQIEKTYQ